MMGFVTSAYAAGPSASGFDIVSFVPLVLISGVFYMLIIRPQQKKAQQQDVFLKNLKPGDQVVSQSGIFGTVFQIPDNENYLILEIDAKVRVRILRSHILELAQK